MGFPIAYLPGRPGRLIPPARAPSRWQARVRRFRRLTPLARVALFVVGAIAALGIEQAVEAILAAIQGPTPMHGELNVAVTEFDARDADGRAVRSQVASDLSLRFAQTLGESLQGIESAIVEVRPPTQAGRLDGDTAEGRARSARELADGIDADVVISGWLDASGTWLQPEFYIPEARLEDAVELAGSFELGSPIGGVARIDDESAAGIQAREALASRARALSELVLGLSFFRLADFARAQDHFERAAGAEGWLDEDGKEIVHLFLGSAAGALGQLDDAEARFRHALALNPDFARARLGLAEVTFQRAKGSCEAGDVDAEGLGRARDAYSGALLATDQPPAANVRAKSHLGIARVDLCLSQAGIEDRWAEADSEATIVIDAFDAGDRSLRQLAAEAHAYRALVALPTASDPRAADHYAVAERELRAAVDLGQHLRPDRLAAYHAQLAYVLGRLGRIDEARQAYDMAISLTRGEAREAYRRLRNQLDAAGAGPRSSSLGTPIGVSRASAA